MAVVAGVRDPAAIRGKIGQTKVKRYRAGRAPEWAGEDEDDDHDDDIDVRTARSSLFF